MSALQFGRVGEADAALRRIELAPVAKGDLIWSPGAARRAAAQRGNPHLELIARLEGLAGPAAPDESGRALALKAPGLCVAVVLLHHQIDEGVRIGEPEVLHHAF